MGLTGDAAGYTAREQVPARAALARDAQHKDEGGIIVFAAFLAILAGGVHFIHGMKFVTDGNWGAVDESGLLFSNQAFWGWVIVLIGIGQVLIGLGLLRGNWIARIAAIAWAALSALAAATLIGAQPFLAIILLGLNIMILNALTTQWKGAPFGE